jgi:hypothetical protein
MRKESFEKLFNFKKQKTLFSAAGCHFTGPLALHPCLSTSLPLSV